MKYSNQCSVFSNQKKWLQMGYSLDMKEPYICPIQCHPRDGGDPSNVWVPAFAGMTPRSGLYKASSGLRSMFLKILKTEHCNTEHWPCIPVLFSLGIHGLVVSFFIFSFVKPSVQIGTVVEIVWEASQEKPALINNSFKELRTSISPSVILAQAGTQKTIAAKQRANKSKIVKATHSIERRRKISFTPLVEQDPSPSGGNLEKGSQKQLAANTSSLSPQRKAYHPLPKYPWISRKRRQEGVVALTVKTNEEGQVIEVNLHKSSGYAPLDESALKTVKTWIFTESNIQKVLSIAFLLKNLEGKLEERV